ncbi:MAG TPA: helix-turn-helix domain-containing protein [Gemmatimonadaceae bacterium]|nr:helix-turn-helix domain-containing protein [Gemmatimonadaceae bacterium]
MTSTSEHDGRPSPSSSPSLEGRLDSWKEVAAYLGRGVRTVQRWEREEGLPVHRLAHDKRGSIYAQREELAAWWESRRLILASQPSEDEPAVAPSAPRFDRVTRTSARTSWPALSSDARLIAYVSDGGDDGSTPQIWVQQIGGAALRLTDAKREYSHLSFSPDDTRVLFTTRDDAGPHIYEIPTLGGDPRLVQRGASDARYSPDAQWLACVPHDAKGIRIGARGGAGFRTIASELVDITSITWMPDSRSILARARPAPALESDWWVAPIDGTSPTNTGMVERLRRTGMFALPTASAWLDDSLIFSAADSQGLRLYRQRLAASTFQPIGSPEPLTPGGDSAMLPTVAAGRVAFLSSREDANLWSIALDEGTGLATGPMRRMTRGVGILAYLSMTRDFKTLAYFSVRHGEGEIFLRDLETASEKILIEAPDGQKWYPAISPDGTQVAFGQRMAGERAARPIFIAHLPDGTWRMLGEDCGGRPRQWVDERLLIIERFARLNSIALIDTATAGQRELLQSAEWSIKNPRLSPDGRWIAFDAARPGEPTNVFVASFRDEPIPEAKWVAVDRSASHPFWSADGRLLYYTPVGTNMMIRSVVRARRFASATGCADGEPFTVHASADMVMPAYLPGTAPIATPNEIIFVLGDFRGDIWLLDL